MLITDLHYIQTKIAARNSINNFVLSDSPRTSYLISRLENIEHQISYLEIQNSICRYNDKETEEITALFLDLLKRISTYLDNLLIEKPEESLIFASRFFEKMRRNRKIPHFAG